MLSNGRCEHEAKTGTPCLSDFDVPVGDECDWCKRYVELAEMARFADKHGLETSCWDDALDDHCGQPSQEA